MAIDGYEWKIGNKKERKEYRRVEKEKATINNNWKDLDEITTKIYVTNFPPGTTPKDLYNLCVKFGRVADVIIPPQVSKYGKRFAFVRFLNLSNDRDKQKIVENIRSTWIGNYHVYANVALFGRGEYRKDSGGKGNGKPQVVKTTTTRDVQKPKMGAENTQYSYATVTP
ncbi:hypothetical protein LXL04_019150 [Taraxacum kok-saghyz]